MASHGVLLPKLKQGTNYTKDVLVLVYLAQGYPNTRVISESELTKFMKNYYPDTNDVQQARHLAAQKGWYILSGTRNDNSSIEIQAGSYKLDSLTKFYPGFTAKRREEHFTNDFWENLKKCYDCMLWFQRWLKTPLLDQYNRHSSEGSYGSIKTP